MLTAGTLCYLFDHRIDNTTVDMATVTVSPKFQIEIPKEIRQPMNLAPGDKLEIVSLSGRIEIVPVKPIKTMRGFLRRASDKNVPNTRRSRVGFDRIHKMDRMDGWMDGWGLGLPWANPVDRVDPVSMRPESPGNGRKMGAGK